MVEQCIATSRPRMIPGRRNVSTETISYARMDRKMQYRKGESLRSTTEGVNIEYMLASAEWQYRTLGRSAKLAVAYHRFAYMGVFKMSSNHIEYV